MSVPMTFEYDVHFHRPGKGARKELQAGPEPSCPAEPGRVPRVARLMALALRFEQLIQGGVVADYAALARLGRVTRARLTQIMNLTLLTPDIQEQILFLPRTERGRDPIQLHRLQPLTLVLDWRKQRRMWQALQGDSPR